MKRRALVPKPLALFTRAQRSEVFSRLWRNIAAQLHRDASDGLSTTYAHVEENDGATLGQRAQRRLVLAVVQWVQRRNWRWFHEVAV